MAITNQEYGLVATQTPQQTAIATAVKQMVDASTAPIKQAQGTYDAQSQANQGNVTGLTAALAAILQGIAPGVEKTYADASTRQSAFAKGFSDHMQAQLGQNATNTSSFLHDIVGAPSSQISQVAGQVAPAAADDTLYGLQGYIPASTLNEEGAAYTASAQQLPGIANTQGLRQISKIQADQAARDADFAQQIGTEAGKAPQYQRQLQQDAFDQLARKHSSDLADAKFNASLSNTAFNQKATAARISLESQRLARSALQSDRSYAIALGQLGISNKRLQLAALADEFKFKNGGFSPTKVAAFKGEAFTTATDGYNGYDVTVGGVTTHKPGFTYQEAVTHLRRSGIPLSIGLPQLNAIYPPGEKGRPLTQAALGAKFAANPAHASDTLLSGSPLLKAAQSMLGTPYVWGGNNPGKALDCSGFLQQTYKRVGVTLARTTYAQVKQGKPVNLNSLQAGDAIFTIPGPKGPEHVGLYIGNGMVQVSPHTGDVNKVVTLKDYLALGFVAARRYVRG